MAEKTHKSVAKRFKVTKNGKLLRRKPGYNHFRSTKSTKQKRQSRVEDRGIGAGIEKRLKKLLAV